MNTRTSLFVVTLLSCWSAPITLVVASPEKEYIEDRDNFIRQFATTRSPQDDSDKRALSKLEEELRLLIGPVDFADFPRRGKINLETLQQDAGFGQVDGLRFGSEHELLFVTTTGLLTDYLQQHSELPTELPKLAKTERFYSLVFDWDAAVTRFAEVPIKTTNDKSFTYAFLGLWAQDVGPFTPKTLFVFFAKGDRVFVVSAKAKGNIAQIPECKDLWDRLKKESDTASDQTTVTEQKAANDTQREDKNFEAYCRCFEQRAKMEPFFKALAKQAQTLVDNLQKQSPR